MGKQGPCYHCGVTSTPLWRNGPPEKPILCNACGSRWRTKGTLVNYTPLHARPEPDEFEDRRVSKVKAISIKNKEARLLRKLDSFENVAGGSSNDILGGGGGGGGLAAGHHHLSLRKGLDEDTSNRSSLGSAISNSDSCMQLGSMDVSDLTGASQSSIVWDTTVPSRKRTCFNRPKQSSVEKLTRDLHTILHEQQSYFSGSSEEDLIFESDTPMVSVEIGHGSVLVRHPNSVVREEESEASSLSFDTKHEAYSWLTSFPVYNGNKDGKFSNWGIKKSKVPMDQDQYNRDNDGKLPIFANYNSLLCNIDLKDIINFEVFKSHMSNDEHQQLLKYLPPIDTAQLPDSLESMFDSPSFMENIFSFQKLLAEGKFDISEQAMKNEEYNLLQITNPVPPSVNVKRLRDTRLHSFPGPKSAMKIPKAKGVSMKAIYEHNDIVDNDDTTFSPRSLFALPSDNNNLALRYDDDNSDHDLLVDLPSNAAFPQAELLSTSSFAGSSSTYQSLYRP